jgi:tetratricopeptide (TPR) repeat protein
MINLFISLAGAALTVALIKMLNFSVWAGLIPAAVVFVALFIALARRSFTQLQSVLQSVQAELSSLNANKKEQQVKADKAVKLLENALPLGKWQFMVEGEIQGQIGMVKHLFKDHAGAMTAFEKANGRNYFAKAMQASIFYQRKEFAAMEGAFEEATKHGSKESLMWAAYAWCLMQNKQPDKALSILSRGVAANPSDEKLKKALTALQNDKRLKMTPWEPMWWQLGLEAPVMQQTQFFSGGRRPRTMRR